MNTHTKRFLLLFLVYVCKVGAVEVPLDESFAPAAYGYAEVPVLVWNDVSDWLYVIAEEDADRFNGQDLSSNLLRMNAQDEWDQTGPRSRRQHRHGNDYAARWQTGRRADNQLHHA